MRSLIFRIIAASCIIYALIFMSSCFSFIPDQDLYLTRRVVVIDGRPHYHYVQPPAQMPHRPIMTGRVGSMNRGGGYHTPPKIRH